MRLRPRSAHASRALSRASFVVAATAAFLYAGSALAQQAPAGSPAAAPKAAAPKEAAPKGAGPKDAAKELAKIPASILSGLLTGTPESLLALKQYLAGAAASPDEIARRALDVVQQLKDSGLVRDPALMVMAAERVTQAVKDTLSSAKIVQVKIDREFRPPAGVIALDFAPADAKVREGFQRVLPNDPRVSGKDIQGLRRPGDDSDMLGDGIVGVEKISVPMPDGEYRVTLMTESIGDATTSLSPFGQKIMANGKEISIAQSAPDAWLKQQVLSNKGLGGFETATERQGGAVTMTVKVTGGKLDMGFDLGGGALKTYMTGMLIEPAAAPPVLTSLPEIRSALFTSPETQTRYESQIASSVATLLERLTPDAGPETNEIARPVQTVQQASPN